MDVTQLITRIREAQEVAGTQIIGDTKQAYRLRLIKNKPADLAVLRRIDTDPAVQAYMYPSNVYLDLTELLTFARGTVGETPALVYAIIPQDEEKMIGWIALYPDVQVLPDNPIPTLEISMAKVSTPKSEYRGVGKVAMQLVLTHLRELVKQNREIVWPPALLLTGYVSAGNVAAQHAMVKAGFTKAPERILYAPHDPCLVYTLEVQL